MQHAAGVRLSPNDDVSPETTNRFLLNDGVRSPRRKEREEKREKRQRNKLSNMQVYQSLMLNLNSPKSQISICLWELYNLYTTTLYPQTPEPGEERPRKPCRGKPEEPQAEPQRRNLLWDGLMCNRRHKYRAQRSDVITLDGYEHMRTELRSLLLRIRVQIRTAIQLWIPGRSVLYWVGSVKFIVISETRSHLHRIAGR